MEKESTRGHRELKGAELQALRAKLSELAMDLPGTLAKLSPEAQQEYRDAEQSVINARNNPFPDREAAFRRRLYS
jgi:hypothetical protein